MIVMLLLLEMIVTMMVLVLVVLVVVVVMVTLWQPPSVFSLAGGGSTGRECDRHRRELTGEVAHGGE